MEEESLEEMRVRKLGIPAKLERARQKSESLKDNCFAASFRKMLIEHVKQDDKQLDRLIQSGELAVQSSKTLLQSLYDRKETCARLEKLREKNLADLKRSIEMRINAQEPAQLAGDGCD